MLYSFYIHIIVKYKILNMMDFFKYQVDNMWNKIQSTMNSDITTVTELTLNSRGAECLSLVSLPPHKSPAPVQNFVRILSFLSLFAFIFTIFLFKQHIIILSDLYNNWNHTVFFHASMPRRTIQTTSCELLI